MNIILGASGQVGSNIVNKLINKNLPVRAVVRNQKSIFDNKVEVRIADFFNPTQLTEAFKGGTTVFFLTPENPASNDVIGETKQIIDNYKKAIQTNGIQKIIGLSSVGAHIEENTGNILMSRMLEHGFDGLDIHKVFIRPSYYFSNWLGFSETIDKYGVLPTFFPEGLKLDMVSPIDVAKFIADIIAGSYPSMDKRVFELVGPEKYSPLEVAATFSKLLKKNVGVQTIPKDKWKEMLKSVGFTENTSANLIDMTQAVIDNLLIPEYQEGVDKLTTTLDQYLAQHFITKHT